jgi:hypothetical protein
MILITALWSWVLPWAAPALGVLRNLRARVGGGGGHGWGLSVAVGLAVVAVWGSVIAWRWLQPPAPLLLTKEQVELGMAKAELIDLRRALAQADRVRAEREADMAALIETNDKLEQEMGALRDKTDPSRRGAVALPADDPWLQQWQGRPKARAGNAKGR